MRPAVLLAALLLALPEIAAACTPGSLVACPPGLAPDPRARIAPLTRADINARVGTPGPPIVDQVTRDTARTWDAVRRQSQPRAFSPPHARPPAPAE